MPVGSRASTTLLRLVANQKSRSERRKACSASEGTVPQQAAREVEAEGTIEIDHPAAHDEIWSSTAPAGKLLLAWGVAAVGVSSPGGVVLAMGLVGSPEPVGC
jgi:hypothetical protein